MARKGGNGADLTVTILKEIRDEIRSTNRRLDEVKTHLGSRIDETNKRIDETNKRLTDTEVRLATAIVDLRTSCVEMRDFLRDQPDLRERVERLERHVGIDSQ